MAQEPQPKPQRQQQPQPPGGADLDEAGIDLLGMDLEALRTVEHPVLSAVVNDLRERITGPGKEALWGFENDTTR